MNDIEERVRAAFRPYRSDVSMDEVTSPARTGAGRRARVSREPRTTPPRPSMRVLTAVAALALFAVVAAVFIVPVLHLGPSMSPPASSGPLLPIWPVQTPGELDRYQAQADDGQHPEALDPQTLAESFAHRVLGWDQVFAVPHTDADPISNLCGLPGAGTPQEGVGCWSPGLPGGYQGIEDRSGYTPAPMSSYALFNCEPGPCDIQLFLPVDVVLYQPGITGPHGVWAVMAASSEWLDLNAQPGETVHDGATLTVSGSIENGDDFRLGVTGAAPCSYQGSTDAFDTTGSPGNAESLDAQMDVHLSGAPGCSGSSPGYVWSAESKTPLGGADPLTGGGPALTTFSAVPVTLVGP